jgi:hypothetical protein
MKMLKPVTVIITVLILLFSCKSLPVNHETINETNKNTENKNIKKTDEKNNANEQETESFYKFSIFNFSVNQDESSEKTGGIFNVTYNISFSFLTNKNITLNYKISDNDGNILLERSDVKTGGISIDLKNFIFKDKFTESFSYSTLKYDLEVNIGKQKFEYSGEYDNSDLPFIDNLKIGPVITKFDNRQLTSSLYVDITLKNTDKLSWIHLIPPSGQYYWDLQTKTDNDSVTSNSIINDSKHKNYIENGSYIIQVNLGKYGVIQKNIEVIDYLNNKTGPNYGLPAAKEISSDKNNINLEMDFADKIDYMELWIFNDAGKNSQKTGIVKFINPVRTILKKELYDMIYDDAGKQVKLSYNKQYYYRIYLYSKEFNSLKYISITDPIPLMFQGFKLFQF